MDAMVRMIDALSAFVGKAAAWLTLAMVLLTTYLVIGRYVLRQNSIALQELVVYMHAAVFMLGAAWALQRDEHVRVDVFYRKASPRRKAIINIFGTALFLLPFAATVLYFSWGYAANAWRYHEGSMQAGGLPYVYVLKTLIPLFAGLLVIQGIAELLRNVLILQGRIVVARED
ncbi:MAG: TRAP transporter small permease subunit [Cardiobacteriaceae bacterium]|nr:TRAP transporter small permease subunit [Cardiobacteriaceae bacterium]